MYNATRLLTRCSWILFLALLLSGKPTASCVAGQEQAGQEQAGQEQAGQAISYTRNIRPILATNCFPCHGPDENTREADLRLDTASGATSDLGGYRAIVPGNPEESELLTRVLETDPDLQMPPPTSHKTVRPEQIELLRNWIAQGAPYEEHWAFVPPSRPQLPVLAGELQNWSDHPIDRFIARRWAEAGLAPAPPASPEVLVRRLYLDLIGLPPTTDQAQYWTERLRASPPSATSAENPEPTPGPTAGPEPLNTAAYHDLVDELLASPQYGEHWARRWLDLARYADTNGYEKDRPRDIWPYRDWVIRALNADLPFADFTVSQLAGDLLPDAKPETVVATGFHRNTMLNEEGGIDPLEYRFYALNDRVATTGTTWLGLTIGCAQCHTHKYDPITHTEYYQLLAFLNNTEEPDLELPRPEQLAAQTQRDTEAKQLLASLSEQWPIEPGPDEAARRQAALDSAFQAWLGAQRKAVPTWQSLQPVSASAPHLKFRIESEDVIFVQGDITKDDTYTLKFSNVPAGTTALRLEVLPDERLPGRGPGLTYFEGPKGDFFLGELRMQLTSGDQPQAVTFRRATHSYAHNHFGGQDVGAELALDGDPQTGWSCAGRFGERHTAVFELESPLPAASDCELTLRFGRHYPCSLGKFRISVTQQEGELTATDLSEETEKLLTRELESLSPEERNALRQAFLLQAPELKAQADKIRELQRRPGYQKTLVLRERPADFPRPTFRHHRGDYLSPREAVQPGVPAFLPALRDSDGVPPRLAFARWLVDPQHPLTWRVAVNRQWSALFGGGLVRTEGDFGLQGDVPSHPELLDWLAVELVSNGGSLKQLQRLLVTSRTYQLSSQVTSEQLAADPTNRWLSRANRKRLSAEQIRDLVLTASGLLNTQAFGPPVFPPQPEGATEIAYGGASWTPSPAPARYRRGIYTFIKRTAPYAMFTTFDAPSGEFCLAQREASNTPLQSLTLLNDPVITEASQHFGQLLSELAGDDHDKLQQLFLRVLGRLPRGEEADQVIAFLGEQRRRLAAGELDPLQLTESLSAANLTPEDRREISAWALAARVVLNLDEAITRN